tara:strand:- start:920 stop:1099 length:180 start_codon:yes stop_codon:yes gene_type:complete
MLSKLKSRKFWFALVGAMGPTLVSAVTGMIDPVEAMTASTAIIISYIFGQAYVDAKALE